MLTLGESGDISSFTGFGATYANLLLVEGDSLCPAVKHSCLVVGEEGVCGSVWLCVRAHTYTHPEIIFAAVLVFELFPVYDNNLALRKS